MPAMRRRWTTENVRALIDPTRAWPRYELIAGELLVTPAPTWSHQVAIFELVFLIKEYLIREAVGFILGSPADLTLRDGTITQPDLFVVPPRVQPRGGTMDWRDVTSLRLAIEVVSPSSARIDRVIKRDFYMSAAVDEYWIIDVDAGIVEQWSPTQETPRIARDRLEWLPAGARTPMVIDLVSFFKRVREAPRTGGQ